MSDSGLTDVERKVREVNRLRRKMRKRGRKTLCLVVRGTKKEGLSLVTNAQTRTKKRPLDMRAGKPGD